jgi:subtilisin family serine protease
VPEHGSFSDDIEPLRDDRFPEVTALGDPALRLVAWLIHHRDFRQLAQRTGIRVPAGERGAEARRRSQFLPVLLQLGKKGKPEIVDALHERYEVPRAYRAAIERNSELGYVTARLPLDPGIFRGSVESLIQALKDLQMSGVTRASLGAPGQPSRKRASLVDIGLPANRKYKNKVLTGEGAIVGIIDDGCALAHCDFFKPRTPGTNIDSRILHLWDQGGTGNTSAGWTAAAGFYGLELNKTAIDAVLNAPANRNGDLVRENAVYQQLGYQIREVETHGTHVMDTAAGVGQSLMGVEGVAPGASIIFVQLPTEAIEGGATALWRYIVDGAAYIFERAAAANRPAVVNVSYGGYDGPHDGTAEIEQALDQLLAEQNRAIVLAAGNGFEARCHARTTVPRNGAKSLRWIVTPVDPTANDAELWYDDRSTLLVRLRAPSGGINPAGWVQLGQARMPITRTSDNKTIGYIEHLASTTGNHANRIVITLNGDDTEADSYYLESDSTISAPAPSGLWTIDLKHAAGPKADVHAWIWRDDAGRARNAQRRQSRFHPDDAHPAHTIAGWATGHLTISVGAYNTATQEICRYSAAGPTRPMRGDSGREKPEVYAPAEEDARGRGVLSASALSARPGRMNGTSAAAPHVAGLIALMFEYAQKHAAGAPRPLSAGQLGRELKRNAKTKALKFNRHQAVDVRVPTKQKDVRKELVPFGKTDFTKTMKKLPQ